MLCNQCNLRRIIIEVGECCIDVVNGIFKDVDTHYLSSDSALDIVHLRICLLFTPVLVCQYTTLEVGEPFLNAIRRILASLVVVIALYDL